MANEQDNEVSQVEASDNSVAPGSLRVDGSIEGSMVIGSHNVVVFTSEQVTRLIAQISTTFQPEQDPGSRTPC